MSSEPNPEHKQVQIHEPFLAEIQKASLPGVWSRGVSLARALAVQQDSQDEEEWVFRVRSPDRPIASRVTLYPRDGDFDCDCDSQASPCMHVAAAVIAIRTGALQARGSESKSAGPRLVYRFGRAPGGSLSIERWVDSGSGMEVLSGSLVSYLGGLQSGRISGRALKATRQDLAADGVFSQIRGALPDANTLAALLAALADAAGTELDGQPVRVSGKAAGPVVAVAEEGTSFRLFLEDDSTVGESFVNGAALCGETLRPLRAPRLSSSEQALLSESRTFKSGDEILTLVTRILPSLRRAYPIEVRTERLPEVVTLPPRAIIRVQNLSADMIAVTPVIVYGNPTIAEVGQGGMELRPGPLAEIPERDAISEHALERKLLTELHLVPGQVSKFSGNTALELLARIRKDWAVEDRAGIESRGVLGARLAAGSSGRFDLEFKIGESTADPERVLKAWHSGENFVPLLDGSWGALPRDWLERFGEQAERLLSARLPQGRLPAHFLPELGRLCQETGEPEPVDLTGLRLALESFEKIPECELPRDFRGELRVYQKRGVDWLCFLRDAGLGALLADDMGLGKTLQALCAVKGRTLIVAPTSVLHSWVSHIERFRPGLKHAVFHGADRELDTSAEVVITSYALLRLDREKLAAQSWDTAILDEAQMIKNPDSQTARAAHSLKAGFKIALSGTPIENRARDLWSQVQFLNPNLLGTRDEFEKHFMEPLERGDARAADELRTRIRPFLLRRLKKDVAPELPPRTELVLHCELAAKEREIYQSILVATRAQILAAEGKKTLATLEALLRLRQACCHRGLVPGSDASPSDSSSKLDLLFEKLEESIGLGHRALVFSQWTSLLDLIESQLKTKGIQFLRLDGSTTHRDSVVEAFQSEDGPPVMILSLKAGGVGLTLTAADHVYIMDPWWNPATEDQAADRAHRIGQESAVFIYRLVALDTVEERVLELQRRKSALAATVLTGSGEATELTREDLLSLL